MVADPVAGMPDPLAVGRNLAVEAPARHPGHGPRRHPARTLEAPTGRFAPPSPSLPAVGLPGARSGDGEDGRERMRKLARGSPLSRLGGGGGDARGRV